MDKLKIERVGGLAGFGGPNLKSSGEHAMSALSAADQGAVEALFQNPTAHKTPKGAADTFRYRITRNRNGQDETVEVPESAVPAALKASVTDKLA